MCVCDCRLHKYLMWPQENVWVGLRTLQKSNIVSDRAPEQAAEGIAGTVGYYIFTPPLPQGVVDETCYLLGIDFKTRT